VAVEQRELDPMLQLRPACGLELLRRVVDADRSRAAAGEPGRDVARATAELDRVPARHVIGQQMQLRLGDPEDAPALLPGSLSPGPLPGGDVFPRERI